MLFARHVLSKPKAERGQWLDNYELHSGKEKGDVMRGLVTEIWKKERNIDDIRSR